MGLAVDVERQIVLRNPGRQAHHHLLGQVAEIEHALVGIIAVGGDLLERGDQFGGAVEVATSCEEASRQAFEKLGEAGPPEIARARLRR